MGVAGEVQLWTPVSPVCTLGPAIDSRQDVREKDSFQCLQDEYISPGWQLLKLYSLYNIQHELKNFPSRVCYSSIDRNGQYSGPLFQGFRRPSSRRQEL